MPQTIADQVAEIEERVDGLSAQVAALAADLRLQTERQSLLQARADERHGELKTQLDRIATSIDSLSGKIERAAASSAGGGVTIDAKTAAAIFGGLLTAALTAFGVGSQVVAQQPAQADHAQP